MSSGLDDRAAVLARRRLLVASALAGAVVTTCEKKAEACLSVAPITDAGVAAVDAPPDADPGPCLSVAQPDLDESAAGWRDAGRPQGCLSIRHPRPPPSPSGGGGCDPPFMIDKNGVRRVKPGCM